jgi:drug/metabolite transporter (DMT)-like permease
MNGFIFGILAMLCWGTSDVLAANALRHKASNFQVFFWSQILRAGIYLLLAAIFPQTLAALPTPYLWVILASGIINSTCYLLFYRAFEISDVSIISPIVSTWSAVAVVLSVIFLHQFLTPLQTFAVALAIGGTFLAAFRYRNLSLKKIKKVKGLGLALTCSAGWGVNFLLLNILIGAVGWLMAAVIAAFAALFFMTVYVVVRKIDVSFPPRQAVFSIFNVGLLEAGGLLAYNYGVQIHSTAYVAPIASTFPLLTVILARIFLKEKPQLHQVIGILLIVAALVMLVY